MRFQSATAPKRLLDVRVDGCLRAVQGSDIAALGSELALRFRFTPLRPAPFLVRVHALERASISIVVIASEDSYRMRRARERDRVALVYADFARSFATGPGRYLAPGDMLLAREGSLDAMVGGKSGIVVIDVDLRAFPELHAVLPPVEHATLTSGDRLATMRLRGCVRAISSMCASEHACASEGIMHRIVEGELVACLYDAIAKSASTQPALSGYGTRSGVGSVCARPS